MLNTSMAICILILSCLSKTSLEVCAHDDGEIHIFSVAGSCEGEHSKLYQLDGGDYLYEYEKDCSGWHNSCNTQNDEHNESCEHEFISFDEEWIACSINCITVDVLQKGLPSSHELTDIGSYPIVLATKSFAPRAPPPWRSDANDYFLKTTRLLI